MKSVFVPEPSARARARARAVTLALALGLLCAAPWPGSGAPASAAGSDPKAASSLELARQLNQVFIDVADKASPAVVVVSVAHKASYVNPEDEDNPFFELLPPDLRRRLEEQREKIRKEQEEQRRYHREPVFDGQGSGVVIRKEGYILTNRHVVDGADQIRVRFRDGTVLPGEVRGVDAQSDVAVIKVDPAGKELVVARLGDSDKTRVGEFAIAIGAPFELDYSVTFGHVSAKSRSRIIPDQSADQDFMQTDANINPGNSGGPLVNLEGDVIGINTLIRGLSTGIGFAIPINLAREVSEKLITDGKFVRAYLGVGIRSLNEDTEFREMILGVKEGVIVTEIRTNTPARRSDLRVSDVITAVDGKPIATAQQLKNEIRGKRIGSPVVLDVFRRGNQIKVEVKPEAWPEDAAPVLSKAAPPAEDNARSLGLTVRPLTEELMEQYGVEKMEGVVVTEVERGSAAERKGIHAGDVITEVAWKPVTNLKQFQQAISAADLKKGVMIVFTTRGTSRVEVLREAGD